MDDQNNGNQGAPPAGLHFLKAMGHAALAWAHVAFGGQNDEEAEEAEARPVRRRIRRRGRHGGSGGAGGSGGSGGSGSCCTAKRK